MASQFVVVLNGEESHFGIQMVDRSKLYGKRKRLNLDPVGETCTRAELTEDGQLLIRSGMTAQGYFDQEMNWIPRNELVGINSQGEAVEKVPSTLGVGQELSGPVPPEELLDLEVSAVYFLKPESLSEDLATALKRGEIYRCRFSYRSDYQSQQAFLIENNEGFFALVGCSAQPLWCELQHIAQESGSEDDSIDDDLDFDMF